MDHGDSPSSGEQERGWRHGKGGSGPSVREEALRRLAAEQATFVRVGCFVTQPLRSVNGGGFALIGGIRQVS